VSNNTAALSVPAVEWHELGPKNLSKIQTQAGGQGTDTWVLAHINNTGAVKSGAHVAKIDRLFQHPTVPNIIYACGGGLESGGGGLFVSHDYGLNWEVLGPDDIPIPDVYSFAIEPYNVSPHPGEQYLFIGLSSGLVYRSSNHGETWI